MRAVVITHAGGPENLVVREIAKPQAGPGEVLVRVQATALNRADVLQREGRYPPPPGAPDTPGLEFAGEVAECGSGATRWPIGARVFGIVAGGAHAEFVVVNQDAVAGVPDHVGWTDAAAIPEAFITAHDAMVSQAGLLAGETVLIHAVASGVGLAAVQLARAWGAIPFGTSRTAEKLLAARELGLEDGVAIHGKDFEPLVKSIEEWTSGRGIDVTLDLVGGPYLAASAKAAALRGRIMIIGSLAGQTGDFPLSLVLRKRLQLRGTVLRSRSLAEKIDATARFEREVVPLLATGKIKPVIDSVYPFDQIADAHRRMESNESVGKIVVSVRPATR
jgi:putative PIG3 family NAD(P)H quinone oxidoreductase